VTDFKGSQFEWEIILWGVRWYVAYPMSYRQLEEMMGERGVAVDHSTLNRWVSKYAPEFEKQFRRRRRPVRQIWRLDETVCENKGNWAYLYRAVDKEGHTIDFLLRPQFFYLLVILLAELGRRVLRFGLHLLDLGIPRLPICSFLILCVTFIARSIKNLLPPTLPSANGSGDSGVKNVGGTRKEMITTGALFCLQS
jgi:hypothetical protein